MNRIFVVAIIILFFGATLDCQNLNPKDTEVWEPEPKVVTPGAISSKAPSDAIILFNGSNLDAWQHQNGKEVEWHLEDGAMTVKKGSGSIKTKQTFGSIQLHIEWRTPSVVKGEGQGRGNSGIFMQEKYELQVLDSYNNRTYSNGQAGSLYKQAIPLVNACKGPGEWQTYDIIYQSPTFKDDSTYETPPYITVLHNGVLIQNHTALKGTTEYIGAPKVKKHGKASIMLQDHGNPVSYRNIWIRTLD